MHSSTLYCLTALLALMARQIPAAVEVVTGGGSGNSDPTFVNEPFSVEFATDGTLYGVEFTKGNRVFKMNSMGKPDFIAGQFWEYHEKGQNTAPAEGRNAAQAVFRGLHDLAINSRGEAYLSDTFGNRICRLNLNTLEFTTIAGDGTAEFAGDGGPGLKSKLNTPICGFMSADEKTLYIADLGNSRVRALDLVHGTISTVAGNGKKGPAIAGAMALSSPLNGPRACAATKDGTLYIVQREGNSLISVLNGKISTLVNASGKKGYAGDGGPAKNAMLNGPKYLAIDPQDNVIICDTENHCLRRYEPKTGKIVLVAGTPPNSGDTIGKDLLGTSLKRPHGVRFDKQGRLYVVDSENNRVLRADYP